MPARHKALILDANILIRAVLGLKVRNLILDNADKVRFFVPEVCLADAKKYLPEILSSKGLNSSLAIDVLDGLMSHMQLLENDWLADFEEYSKERMQSRDPDDWPVLAAALALDCPIWTQDEDFFGVGVVTWTTQHIENFFRS
ncbi:COG5378 Predicted nucleotide-binding protein [Oxalobacteraceae bacterium]|jgi:predicted nucleic acid-binding protein